MDDMTAIDYIRELHQREVENLQKQIATLTRENETLHEEIETLKQQQQPTEK